MMGLNQINCFKILGYHYDGVFKSTPMFSNLRLSRFPDE